MTREDADRDLRQKAFDLLDEGWNSAEVAELLEIKTMTVAGWMSWRTRGHYTHEEDVHRRRHLRVVK